MQEIAVENQISFTSALSSTKKASHWSVTEPKHSTTLMRSMSAAGQTTNNKNLRGVGFYRGAITESMCGISATPLREGESRLKNGTDGQGECDAVCVT